MTDEVQNTDAAPEEQNINISIEQILAATLKHQGKVTIPLEDLIANYGGYSIAVTQNEDKSVTFELTEVPQQQAEVESEE